MHNKEFSILQILDILKKRVVVILLTIAIFTSLSAYINLFLVQPYYEADIKLFIGKKNIEDQVYSSNDIDLYQKLLKTYSEIIQTDDLIEKACRNSKLNVSTAEIKENLSVIPGAETQILEISYVSYDKREAQKVLVAVTNEFITQGTSLIPNVNIQIIQSAKVPQSPIGPRSEINIIVSAFIGLILSVSIIIFFDHIDNRVRNKEQIEEKFKIPVIGQIPFEKKKDKNKNILIEKDSIGLFMESYRIMRTKIQHINKGKEAKIMVVTSTDINEGKSTVASNLAISFAKIGKKVILIDYNLRKPALQNYFYSEKEEGLVEIINKEVFIDKVAIDYNQNLKVLLSGKIPRNPADILESQNMNDFFENLKREYDLIIIDTVAIDFFTDTQILIEKADGTILVSRAYKSRMESLNKGIEKLSNISANIIGVVLNGVKDEKIYKKYNLYR